MTHLAWHRIAAIVAREWADVRLATLWSPLLLTAAVIALPLGIIALGRAGVADLASDADLQRALTVAVARWEGFEALGPLGRAQAFVLQQFLVLLLLVPIQAGLLFASHSVVGDKVSRALEPVLATPISTPELLIGKTLGALLPSLLTGGAAMALYAAGILVVAEPGVALLLANARTAILVGVIGPLVTLIGLQIAVLASARTNDARSAQQWGTFVIVPVVALMLSQASGMVWLGTGWLLALGAGLAVAWLTLASIAWAVFDRERILTDWT